MSEVFILWKPTVSLSDEFCVTFSMKAEMLEAIVRRFRCTLKKAQVVQISAALHCASIHHNRIVVLRR